MPLSTVRSVIDALPAALIMLLVSACTSTPTQPQPSAADAARLNYELAVGYLSKAKANSAGDRKLFDVAQDKLEKALSYKEDYPEAHNALGVLYDETGQDALAGQHFQRAIALDAGFSLARVNYGQFLCTQGQPEAGISQYLGAAQAVTDKDRAIAVQAYFGAAVCALAVPDRPRAREFLTKALELQPNEAAALYRLADLSYAEGDYPAASAYLQRYHARAGYSPESLWLGISIEERLGNAQQRRQYQDLLLSRFANSEPARRLKSP